MAVINKGKTWLILDMKKPIRQVRELRNMTQLKMLTRWVKEKEAEGIEL